MIMGRQIMRVPLDFDFPLEHSYADAAYSRWEAEHKKTCRLSIHDDCGFPHWAETVPKGDGWQLWQTVSDGPISPVFATPEDLIEFMAAPATDDDRAGWNHGYSREAAEKFVRSEGWAPSFVVVGRSVMSGVEYAAIRSAEQ